jgi:hypothetical protein
MPLQPVGAQISGPAAQPGRRAARRAGARQPHGRDQPVARAAGVAAQRGRMAGGEDDPARLGGAVLQGRGVEAAADPETLVGRPHAEEAEAPDALADQPDRGADDLALQLGHPAAARVRALQMRDTRDAALGAARLLLRRDILRVELLESGGGRRPRSRDVGFEQRADRDVRRRDPGGSHRANLCGRVPANAERLPPAGRSARVSPAL